ncbi:hypothetical protein GF324_02490 [bacterium]|nr:hypothetical protein [bacterium]
MSPRAKQPVSAPETKIAEPAVREAQGKPAAGEPRSERSGNRTQTSHATEAGRPQAIETQPRAEGSRQAPSPKPAAAPESSTQQTSSRQQETAPAAADPKPAADIRVKSAPTRPTAPASEPVLTRMADQRSDSGVRPDDGAMRDQGTVRDETSSRNDTNTRREDAPRSRSAQPAATQRSGEESSRAAQPASKSADEPAGRTQQQIRAMESSGWRIGVPKSRHGQNGKKVSLSSWRSNVAPVGRDGKRKIDPVTRQAPSPQQEATQEARNPLQSPQDARAADAKAQPNQAHTGASSTPAPGTGGTGTEGHATVTQSTQPNSTASAQSQATQQQARGEGAMNPSRGLQNLDEVLKKIEGRARMLTENGRSTMQIRLRPASLGAMMVKVHEDGGTYHVSLKADSPDAAKAIESQIQVIRDQLSQAGIQVDGFDVQTGGEKRSSWAEAMGDRNGNGRGGQGRGEDGFPGRETPPDEALRPEERRLNLGTNTVDYVG